MTLYIKRTIVSKKKKQLYITKKSISTNVFVACSNVELQVLGQQVSSVSAAAVKRMIGSRHRAESYPTSDDQLI